MKIKSLQLKNFEWFTDFFFNKYHKIWVKNLPGKKYNPGFLIQNKLI